MQLTSKEYTLCGLWVVSAACFLLIRFDSVLVMGWLLSNLPNIVLGSLAIVVISLDTAIVMMVRNHGRVNPARVVQPRWLFAVALVLAIGVGADLVIVFISAIMATTSGFSTDAYSLHSNALISVLWLWLAYQCVVLPYLFMFFKTAGANPILPIGSNQPYTGGASGPVYVPQTAGTVPAGGYYGQQPAYAPAQQPQQQQQQQQYGAVYTYQPAQATVAANTAM